MPASRPTVCVLIGTRPEAIKMAPVVRELRRERRLRTVLIASGQHEQMVEQALAPFGLAPDRLLLIRRESGAQVELVAALGPLFHAQLDELEPAAVVVQGDTTTALAGALTAFWRGHAVIHVEAGLRSGDLQAPFPEEANRRLIDQISVLLLAPTTAAAENLAREGIAGPQVVVTGNPVVSAIHWMVDQRLPYDDRRLESLEASGRTIVLATMHRRESWGAPMYGMFGALRTLLDLHPEITIVLPAHPNPAIRVAVNAALSGVPGTLVCDSLAYPDLARLLSRASLALTDSGGIQEEAPTFGVPVLILRNVTERPEAIHAGCAHLVGTDPERIVAAACSLLAAPARRERMACSSNPFGDECSARRCAEAILWRLDLGPRPQEFDDVSSLRPPDIGLTASVHRTGLRHDKVRQMEDLEPGRG